MNLLYSFSGLGYMTYISQHFIKCDICNKKENKLAKCNTVYILGVLLKKKNTPPPK